MRHAYHTLLRFREEVSNTLFRFGGFLKLSLMTDVFNYCELEQHGNYKLSK